MAFWKFFSKKKDKDKEQDLGVKNQDLVEEQKIEAENESQVESQESRVDEIEETEEQLTVNSSQITDDSNEELTIKNEELIEAGIEAEESRQEQTEPDTSIEAEKLQTTNYEPPTASIEESPMEVHQEEVEEAGIESNVECGIENGELEEQETMEQETVNSSQITDDSNEELTIKNEELIEAGIEAEESRQEQTEPDTSIEAEKLQTTNYEPPTASIEEPAMEARDDSQLTEEDMKVAEKPKAKNWFSRLRTGLSKTRDSFTFNIRKILNFGKIDEDTLEELEDLFIQADIGTGLTLKLIEQIEKKSIMGELTDTDSVMNFLKEEFKKILERDSKIYFNTSPKVFLVVGVNGAGKTTTIGKLTKNFKQNGKNVLLVAGDTFRAAAIEQLEIWANRNKCPIIKHTEGSDSAAVVYDGVSAGVSRKMDTILVDTAGRLHNKVNLMKELEKIKRVVKKAAGDIEVETLLVIDATSGQNGLIQAKTFKEVIDIDGILLTKMDGTAKGGIILPIVNDLNVPVKYIGVGEGIDDLREFSAEDFVKALFD